MDAVVHLGLNKTGTTSIQAWLARHRPALEANGILYDRFDGRGWEHPTSQEHFVMALYGRTGAAMPFTFLADHHGLATPEDLAAFAAGFEDTLAARIAGSPCRTFLISSEFLGAGPRVPALVADLDGWLRARFETVRYILYLRDPEHWILSRYAQLLKHPEMVQSLDAYVAQHRHAGFRQLLETWRGAVGDDRLAVRLYDESWRGGPGLIEDFRAAAGLPDFGPADIRRNVSFTEKGDIALFARENAGSDAGAPSLAPEHTAAIRAANAEDEAWIRATYFPDAATLFPRAERSGGTGLERTA